MKKNALVRGLVAGAAGTAALDIVTYLDMAIRGRPPSEVPKKTVQRLAQSAGLHVLDGDDGKVENRRTAAGAIAGYMDGLCAGAAYGAARSLLPIPWYVGATALAGLTLLVGEGTAVRAGATDWRTWSAADWISDLVPRAVYGVVTARAYDMLDA
ncbi:MAG: hypothetical protein ACREMP_00510 [Candidatus Tyrphobacter sp.]